ncbi:MAG: hypothetical protein KatS3mg126_0550 [Lysobacteraceae bacterium]|nr:MAG: hypothetical protein KatS3mg126_0550 [Xanthomonadaceae bacterium]
MTGRAGLWCALLVGAALAGCASTPPPTAELAAAEAALHAATQAGAADFAPVELGFARDKLAQAQAAAAAREHARARAVAEQALVDAQLALAKSQAARARAELQARSEENAALRRELLGEDTP